jgi:predicted metal-dependent enzyme (double-stranded beta helix superfamily)
VLVGIFSYYLDMKSGLLIRRDQGLGNLLGSIREVTRRRADWAETAALVADRLRIHLPTPDLLTAEQRYGDPLGYRCHLLHTESDGSFSVVAMVWRPGQDTPIHDHVTWSATGVIQGSEHEDRYLLRDDCWLEHIGTRVSAAGEVTSAVPPGDIHRVRNNGPHTTISLHVYGTDLSRLGSGSVRRTYDLPVVAGTGSY